ncbi:hypothetical protein MPTK1_1g22140 [Marchantia polymorpha subsp. ruderalis]|uniref:XS domain-containing protein n=2 Tax=Marchantia polymorpha TaxID=3197 RepID=A0A176VES8_MARPO|nr:hypothetical protein AXG93_436s1370 [Marchantia polymorpha subsp. ruderalis]PTQ50664.1 hypothetical protein MARPO_0001s0551 [Marchantia polymorpha]BBM99577.1 hypothetical protein Mp_1g22140 [Marchantia polymorpha subsp. ruderalis]|eukprot:PTQ50664.1 hypothetical protein MARPO_0001s0551 [Marchantia polymorpha]
MEDEDDVHNEYSDDDIETIEEESFKLLESKKVVVENEDGTFRCPYSPSRKKQSYPFKDLLQHAEGVAKGKRGAEAVGQHRALVNYMKKNLSAKASVPVERVHKLELAAPQREGDKDLLVCPWSGVVYNMDNSQLSESGQRVGPGVSEIKKHFEVFSPEKAIVCWGPKGHMGLGVLIFRRDLEGLKDAQAFEKWFIENGQGRRDWEQRNRTGSLGNQLYGWLARKQDYEGRHEIKGDWSVSKILKESGDLTDIAMIGQEMNRMHEQRFQNLKETVYAKNEEFEVLLHEVEVARRRAEDIKLQLEEKHKKELERVKKLAQESALDHARVMQENSNKLQKSMNILKRKCQELEEKEQRNQVDKSRLEQEKKENQQHLDIINHQSELQKKHHADQVKLIKKHEEESNKLAQLIQTMKLRLATKQQREIETQRLGEMKDSKKFAELVENFDFEFVGKNVKELEDKIKEVEKKNADLEEHQRSLNEDLEAQDSTLQTLTVKERIANSELEEARNLGIQAMQKFGSQQGIFVKRMGEINSEPWRRECKVRYKKEKDGWETIFGTKFSEWEEKVKNPDFHAFKIVKDGNEDDDKWKRVLDETNPDLLALKEELGEEVKQTVVTALEEIEEWNPSGRYPKAVVWNYEENRRATVSEIFKVLLAAAESSKKKTVAKRRRLVEG